MRACGITKSCCFVAISLFATQFSFVRAADTIDTLVANRSPPSLSSATVVIDAAVAVSESGEDDIAAARGIFRSAGYPESNGGLESSSALIAGLAQRASRTINAEDGSLLDASGTFTPSNRLNWNLPWIARYGLIPHVIVGQKQPAFITTPASQWDATTWAKYQDYATKLVRWTTQFTYSENGTTFNFQELIFEVGNEVDITKRYEELWTLPHPSDPELPQGDASRYQHYMNVYTVWAKAVAQVAAESPYRTLHIAGPAMGGQSLFLNGSLWHEQFVANVAAAGLRLDLLTLHFYGDVLNGWKNVPNSSLRAQLARMRAALTANGRGYTPIHISEYGASGSADAVYGHINYTHEGAAWAAAFINEAVAGTATGGNIVIVRDNIGPNTTGTPSAPSLDYIRNGVDYPKPIYNTFKMFKLLPDRRKAVTTPAAQPDVRAFAAAEGQSAGVIVYNYNYQFAYPGTYEDLTTSQSVTVGFKNLPFSGTATVERYLIDADTSNLAKYLDGKRPPLFDGTMLTRVERCGTTVSQGVLVLAQRTLGPSAVSLWLVNSGPTQGMKPCM
ncbi:MAG TPA: hypothetical protein VNT02_10530 [Burkholderiales bacterium]|nr:hypothetical protein [Burkholderiales bacterium]